MPAVRGCNLPDDLLYDVDNHIWFTEVGDGTVKLGVHGNIGDISADIDQPTGKQIIGRKNGAGIPTYSQSAAPIVTGVHFGQIPAHIYSASHAGIGVYLGGDAARDLDGTRGRNITGNRNRAHIAANG